MTENLLPPSDEPENGRVNAGAELAAKLFGLGSPRSGGGWDPGGLFGASVREWRNTNMFEEMVEAAEKLRLRGVSIDETRALPVGDAYRIFENGSKVDDPRLRSMWASLLANSIDPNKTTSPRPLLVDILNRLGSLEAGLLEFLYSVRKLEDEARAEVKPMAVGGNGRQAYFALEKAVSAKITQAYDRAIAGQTATAAKHALSLLIREDLVSANIPAPNFAPPPFIDRQRQVVSADGLLKVLKDLTDRTDHLRGGSDARLTSMVKDGKLFYHLTSFGRELMDACH